MNIIEANVRKEKQRKKYASDSVYREKLKTRSRKRQEKIKSDPFLWKKEKQRLFKKGKASSKKRREFITSLKLDKECFDCKKKFPPYVLDFDHVRGKKMFQISNSGNISMKSLLNEVKKCELVCANCHRVRTHTRGQYGGHKTFKRGCKS